MTHQALLVGAPIISRRNEAVKIPESELPQGQRQYWIHDDHKIHTLLFVCTQTVPLLQILEKFP